MSMALAKQGALIQPVAVPGLEVSMKFVSLEVKSSLMFLLRSGGLAPY